MNLADKQRSIADARLPSSNMFERLCCEASADPTGWIGKRFSERECFCTRPFHLDGVHVARAMDGSILSIWEESAKEVR